MVWHLPKTGRFLLETWVVSFHLAWYAAANPPSHFLHQTTTLPWWLTEQTSRMVLRSFQITAAILRASQISAAPFGAWQPSRLEAEQPSELQGASQSAPGSHSRARSHDSRWSFRLGKLKTHFFNIPELKISPFSFEWKILKCHYLFQFSTKNILEFMSPPASLPIIKLLSLS